MSHPLKSDALPQTERTAPAQATSAPAADDTFTDNNAAPSPDTATGTPAPNLPDDETWKTAPGLSGEMVVAAGKLGMFGNYELLEEVAQGGMGIVYKARQPGLERVVALKMILSGQFARKADVERFYQEARAAARLDHPHIVPIYEIGQHEGQHYFTMAFIEGDSLTGMVLKKGPVPPREAATLVASVADGVQFAHTHGIIHRDLKPDNVLLDRQGRPRVTDFGLAKQLEAGGGLTSPGQILGTPSFMAPEQARGDRDVVGPAADIYALGGILYFMLTGKPPFNGSTLTDVLYQVAHEEPQPPRQHNPAIPPDLEAICLKCLHKDPTQRYPNAGAVAEALRFWAAGQTIPSTTPSTAAAGSTSSAQAVPVPASPSRRPTRRRLALAGGLAVLVAGITCLALYLAGVFGDNSAPVSNNLPGPQKNDNGQPIPVDPANPFVMPDKLNQDFGLQVDVEPAASKDGVLQLEAGAVTIRVKVERDAYVGIWSYDSDGIPTQIFPNKHEPNHRLQAGIVYTIPGNDRYEYETEPSRGVEHLWVVASTRRWDALKGEEMGPFTIFRSPEEKHRMQDHLQRIIRIKKRTGSDLAPEAVSEKVLPMRILPRK
jgi:serine/threonine protein kinase